MDVCAPAAFDHAAEPVSLNFLERVYSALAPGIFRLALVSSRLGGTSAEQAESRVGVMPPGGPRLLWFHGASVGELMAASGLVRLLRGSGFQFTAAFTTTNRAGLEYLSRAGERVAALVPFDVAQWLKRALDAWSPKALFLIETELWPRMIFEASVRQIPVFAVSARIYSRDVARYRLVKPIVHPMLRRISAVLAQNETERQHFVELGADPNRCTNVGNLKFAEHGAGWKPADGFRESLGLLNEESVVVFGSIHDDEVTHVLEICDHLGDAARRIIIAPRHRAAADSIQRGASKRRWQVARRSDANERGGWRVLILDTIGELKSCYSIATAAVIGGGFRSHGGHNPMESIECGAPVVLGRHFENFAAEAEAISATCGEARQETASGAASVLQTWLRDPAARTASLNSQRRALPDAEQIAKAYLEKLSPWLKKLCA